MKKIFILCVILVILNITLFILIKLNGNIFDKSDLNQNIIIYKIKNLEYKSTKNGYSISNDYDLFLIDKHIDLEKIKELVGNKKESRFYYFFNTGNKKETIKIISLLYMNEYKIEIENYFRKYKLNENILKEICIPSLKQKNKDFLNDLKDLDYTQYLERDWDGKECDKS